MKAYYFQVNVDFEKDTARSTLLVLLKKFKEAIDTGNKFEALLTDLPKAFDCLNHSLLVAKLHWYEHSPLSFKLIFSYFSNRTHRTKINKYLVTD